tara:strand:- start:279 stop:533 length:255 start_codon:yes stop_codon:yes gene_type:complete
MTKSTLEKFEFTVKHLFLLKDCYNLIEETLEENIELYTWDFEERQCLLKAIDEAIEVVKEDMPKFTMNKERHLRLVLNNNLQEE